MPSIAKELKAGPYNVWDLDDAMWQDTYWKTKGERILRLTEMETDHLLNLLGHLDRNRYRVLAFEEARYLLEGASGAPWADYDDVEHAWQQILESDPRTWLHGTPLWKAIVADLAKRGIVELPALQPEKATPGGLRGEAFGVIVRPVMTHLSNRAKRS